ncbi:MAG: acetyl-CoA acetyltransferase [candidate division Zixibacteria bacterium RBG_16_53_22]|nr:MAG: acetyl-CoA acetyltransferase [candidate division Zixibacteria bacterium RBG_16_53_22]
MRDVAVIGIGMNKWGEVWEKSISDLIAESALLALDDAGLDKVDAMYIGCMSSGLFTDQEHLGSIGPDYAGICPTPGTRVESACASGGAAIRSGFLHVASGASDIVMVVGVEKMTDVDGAKATFALATAADQEYEVFHGVTFPGLYAMMANHHMNKYCTTRDQLAQVAVKNHKNGKLNPLAQFQMDVTLDQVKNAVMVSDPLTILDCSPITDGAAAVILCPADKAKSISKKRVVKVKGSGHASDTIQLAQRKDLSYLKSTEIAAKKALEMAGRKIGDINFAEVHDCFTIAEIMVVEALGAVEVGKGGPATMDGVTAVDGKFPVNASGGLKSKGHPVGATGVAQIVELVKQIRGTAEKGRQVKNANIGLAQNMGGSGASSVVHILEGE